MTAWCSRAKALEAAVRNETDLPSLLEPPTAATRLSERGRRTGVVPITVITDSAPTGRYRRQPLPRKHNVAAEHPFMNLTTCFRVCLLQGDKEGQQGSNLDA